MYPFEVESLSIDRGGEVRIEFAAKVDLGRVQAPRLPFSMPLKVELNVHRQQHTRMSFTAILYYVC
jgi:hypothetical protein